MMGIGFGRPDQSWGPNYLPSLVNNALLHIEGMDEGTVRAGYILTPTGIYAGLTGQNTAGNYAYMKLIQQTIAGQLGTQWQTAQGTITIAGPHGVPTVQYGTMILMDTGLDHFFGSTGTTYEQTDRAYHFTVGLLGGAGVAGYTFSASGNAINAASLSPSSENFSSLCGPPATSCGYTPASFEQNSSAYRPA